MNAPRVWLLFESGRIVQNFLSRADATSAGTRLAHKRYGGTCVKQALRWYEVDPGLWQLVFFFTDPDDRRRRQPVSLYVQEYEL